MQTRYMERSNSMAREKRKDLNGSEEDQPDKKRPALARSFYGFFNFFIFPFKFYCFFC